MRSLPKKTLLLSLATLMSGLLIGYVLFSRTERDPAQASTAAVESTETTIWTCSMHPQIRKSEPGNCPICGMDLIPLESSHEEGVAPEAIRMSPAAMKLAQVQTLTVGNGQLEKVIRLNGKVQADERLLFTQSSHIAGRIEKLAVNFRGDRVNAGDVIAHIYSPELVTAQRELKEAEKIKESQPKLFQAAREKLKNWKLSDRQIDALLASDQLIDTFPITATASGYVTEKMVNHGDYVKRGEPLYQLANLSKVWVLFDVYESAINSIEAGMPITYTIHSLPGQTFRGRISYIDPTIDPQTRVAKARVETANPNLSLKPEMFASGTVEAKIDAENATVTVPKSAVMWTGKRSLVYVMNKTPQGVFFSAREVLLGSELNERVEILSGVVPGEEIAVHGTFNIDAAAQLAGKPSMMNPEGSTAMDGHTHGDTRVQAEPDPDNAPRAAAVSEDAGAALRPLFKAYFELQAALANDDFDQAKASALKLKSALAAVDMDAFHGASHTLLMRAEASLKDILAQPALLHSIDSLRQAFISVSDSMIALAEAFEPLDAHMYVQHCPMANSNRGADWLSLQREIRNPYFGSAMLSCGEISKTIK